MARNYILLLRRSDNNDVAVVINPMDDAELDNPAWANITPNVGITLIPERVLRSSLPPDNTGDPRTKIYVIHHTITIPDPGDWNPRDNRIEVVARGGQGRSGTATSSGGGGGGGGYLAAFNANPGFPFLCSIPPLNNNNPTVVQRTGSVPFFYVGANYGGYPSTNTNAGAPGLLNTVHLVNGGWRFVGFSGGSGGVGGGTVVGGGGGGGAGGPNGEGGVGATLGGAGGAADGGAAGADNRFGLGYGLGAGGAGSAAGSAGAGGTGGLYGGGGGGSAGAGNPNVDAGPGLAVIRYRPLNPRQTRVYLHAGVTSFPDPRAVGGVLSLVECVGAGGLGGPADDVGTLPGEPLGGGGGGGAYAYQNDVSPSFPVSCRVEQEGLPGNPLPTFFASIVAPTGLGATFNIGGAGGGTGGAGAPSPSGFVGGRGGESTTSFGTVPPGGGGGAGGPNGAGSAGQGTTAAGPGPMAGGAADGGTVAGATAGGAAGSSGTQWDNIHGIGSGGAGGVAASPSGGAGGRFGGGGGGSRVGSVAQSGPGLIVITYEPIPPPPKTRVFLYANVTSFPNPGNWNPDDNTVECVGAGGPGGDPLADRGGGGGGGGAYAVEHNVAISLPAVCVIPPAGQTDYATIFGTSPTNVAFMPAGVIFAENGSTTSLGGSGQAGWRFGPNGYRGGSGGSALGFDLAGAGGGGAAGPNGEGQAGGNPTSGTAFGQGGASDNATVARPPATNAAPGVSGAQWDNIHGTGSGGNGSGSFGVRGGHAGRFGGGAGGAHFSEVGQEVRGGAPSAGLIVITYTPLAKAARRPRAIIVG